MEYSTEELLAKASAVLEGLPCDYAEVRLSSGAAASVSFSGDNKDLVSGDSTIGSVRLLKDGAWGFISFNDIAGIGRCARRALDMAAALRLAEKSSVYHVNGIKKHFATSCARKPEDVSIGEKFDLVKKYNDILKAHEKIQSTRALYTDRISKYVYANTDGAALSFDKTYCGISLTAMAKEGSVVQSFHESVSAYAGYETVLGRESDAERVAKTAVDLLNAESAPGQNCSVIVDQKLAGVFIHEAFGHMSEADFIYENKQMLDIMVLGQEFGPAELNVFDDGNISDMSGYIPFDDEGIIPEKTPLIANGILAGRLHSRETAQKMGESPTGNGRALNASYQPIVRMTNTYIENGKHPVEDIFAAVDDGIYAIGVIGGQTNLEMFTFTSLYGYEIKNGRIGKMLRDIQLSGNVFTTLKNIAMIGNDLKMSGGLGGCGKGGQSPLAVSYGGPHLLIKKVLVGGRR